MSAHNDSELSSRTMTAFAGDKSVAEGSLHEVAKKLSQYLVKHPEANFLVFDNQTSVPIEIDLRGSLEEVLSRLKIEGETEIQKAGPGRPKLGVITREIGLLPRHWEWLAEQNGGASVTLRKLVEDARRANQPKDEMRQAQNAAYKFMAAMAGNLPHFEEAQRAFFAGNKALFETLTSAWPKDLRNHSLKLSEKAFK